jgi:hypothetical protein
MAAPRHLTAPPRLDTLPGVTYYEVLGVSTGATAKAIRRAYVDRARLHHPDFHTNADASVRLDAEREMQRLNDAWAVLGDPQRRREYDATLRGGPGDAGANRFVAAPDDGWDPRSGVSHPDFVPFDDDPSDPDYNAVLDLDDTPFPGASTVPRWQQLLPVGLFAASLACLCIGLVVKLGPLLVLGIFLFLGSGLSFVATPMLAVFRGYERDPDR